MAKLVTMGTDALGITDSGAPARIAGAIPNKTFGFGRSRLTNKNLTIDPKIEALQAEGRTMAESTLKNVQGAREDVIGDRSDFVQNRTEGLREKIERQKTALDTGLEKRGVSGEFGEQSRESFAADANQKINQGEKLAFDELMNLEGNFDQLEGGAISAINSLDMNDFAQRMASVGMSDSLVRALTQIQLRKAGIAVQDDANAKNDLGNILMAGALFF